MTEAGARNGSELCLTCGLCCRGVLHSDAIVLVEEVDRFGPEFDLRKYAGHTNFYFDLPCRYIGEDNRCEIYAKGRPHICGAYVCKLLRKYLDGEKDLATCLAAVTKAKKMIEQLTVKVTSSPESGDLDQRSPGSGTIKIWDYVGEFLAGNFEKHSNAKVDLRALDGDLLHQIAELSFYLEKTFIPPRSGVDSEE